jgi:hypothetical protein
MEAMVKRKVLFSGIQPRFLYLSVFIVCKTPDSTNRNVNPLIFTFSRAIFDILTQKQALFVYLLKSNFIISRV